MTDPLDLDGKLDALFASAPDEFVRVRDALVGELRAAGRDDDATTVRALRRPTVAVAAVNQVAREQPALVADLVDAGDRLADLQVAPQSDPDALRELTRERRALLTRLTELAAKTTQRPEAARTSIGATLDAAALDAALRPDLLRGRLTQELAPSTRFVAQDDSPRAPSPARRAPRKASTPPPDELAARRARAELERVRERVEEIGEAHRERLDAAADAAVRLEHAHEQVTALEAALAEARTEVADAKRAERDAQRAEQRARAEHDRVIAALRAAERAVEDDEPSS